MEAFNVDKDYQVTVIEKILTLLKQEDIILNPMTQTGEKYDSLDLIRDDF